MGSLTSQLRGPPLVSLTLYLFLSLLHRKCQKYSPNENVKAFEKAVVKKQWQQFEPVSVLQEVKREVLGARVTRSKEECLRQYLEVPPWDR